MAALATDDAVPGESAVGAAATSSKEVGRDVLGTKLLLRGRQGIHLMHGPNGGKGLDDAQAVATVAPDSSVAPAGGLAEFSPDGSLLARTGGSVNGVEVVSTAGEGSKVVITGVASGRVQKLAWSPMSTYLVTWQKFETAANNADTPPELLNAVPGTGNDAGDGEKGRPKIGNLRVWVAATGALVDAWAMKKMSTMIWPALQWTSDEAWCMRMVSNEVHVYKGGSIADGVFDKIRLQGVASFALSPSPQLPVKVALFKPEAKAAPASVHIYTFPGAEGRLPVASKSFFQAQEITMEWSPNGEAVLVKTHTDVDATGASYYGSTGLYILHGNGAYESEVMLQKAGPVSDAKWSPVSKGFVVVCGTMPAVATLYDLKAKPIFNFGEAHRNTISWAPHGRFLCLAGFGNLAGDMDFWDVNKQKKMGSNNSHCAVVHGWSPDSRFFMTATTRPRMNVDNGLNLFRYTGVGPVHSMDVEELYDVRWRPAAVGVYENRPQSPTRVGGTAGGGKGATLGGSGGGGAGGGGASGGSETKSVGAYRPPGARGRGGTGGSSLAALAGETVNSGPAKVKNGGGLFPNARSHQERMRPVGLPVGAALPDAHGGKSKSAMKREKAARKKEQAEAAAAELARLEAASGGAARPEPVAAPSVPLTAEDKAKRVKKLNKTLKAIEGIKEKKAAGTALNEDQKAKLATEDSIRKELADLEA